MSDSPRTPTIDELISLPVPTDAQLSPCGERVAFVVQTVDFDADEYRPQLFVAEVDGTPGTQRQLTFAKGGSQSPRWSPCGGFIAFTSKREGDATPQLYRMRADGGEAERLTGLATAVSAPRWSPDGARIAFRTEDPETPGDLGRVEKHGTYRVHEEDCRHTHAWLVDVDPVGGERTPRRLTGGRTFDVRGLAWSPDGERLAIDTQPTPSAATGHLGCIRLLTLASLVVTELTTPGSTSPCWSPDGDRIAFSRSGEPAYYQNRSLWTVAASGGDPARVPTTFDENLHPLRWVSGGLLCAARDGPEAHLYRVGVEGGGVDRVTPGDGNGWLSPLATFDAAGECAAAIVSDGDLLPEVCVIQLPHGGDAVTMQRLTAFTEDVAQFAIGPSQAVTWTSTDGTEIEGILTTPIGWTGEESLPLLVVIHGGPAAASSLELLSVGARRAYPIPMFVARGALVLQPNYRGSAGYGESFRALNVRNLGVGDAEDVNSGVDALVDRGWVDPDRVGAMGWSQGGYIAAFLGLRTSRYRAVSVGAGVSSWRTYHFTTDIHPFAPMYLEATPWDDAQIYEQTAPMAGIASASTPTLIQHGEADSRVHVANAHEIHRALSDRGVETRLSLFPGQGHGLRKPRTNRYVMEENVAWFGRHVFGDDASPPRPTTVYVVAQDSASARATAARDDAELRVLHPREGLMPPGFATGAPLTEDDVAVLVFVLPDQLRAGGWTTVTLLGDAPESDDPTRVRLGTLQVAAGIVGGLEVSYAALA